MTAAQDAARMQAHSQLMSTVADLAESGRPAPCLGRNGSAWTAEDDPEATTFAAEMCRSCPALQACGDYVTEFPEPSNSVWAGMTLNERNKRK